MFLYFLRQIKWNRASNTKWGHLVYYTQWKASLAEGRNSVKDRSPWITLPAVDLLKKELRSTDKVFEYGGGGSTLFWVDRVAEVVTVEHDREWYQRLEEVMKENHGAQWTGKYVAAEQGDLVPVPDAADPLHYASQDEVSRGMNFKAYASEIDRYPDGHFNVVMVDGRARASCIHHAVPKLASGGLLILDNAERAHYLEKNKTALREFDIVLQGMAPALYNRDFSETRIFRKR